MGFKDKIRNNQNAQHATLEDYRKSVEEKYVAERALRLKPTTTIEVPPPVIEEPIKPFHVEQIEAPAFVKSRVFEPIEPELVKPEPEEPKSVMPELVELESEEVEEAPEEAVEGTEDTEKVTVEETTMIVETSKKPKKAVKKNTKFKKKEPTAP